MQTCLDKGIKQSLKLRLLSGLHMPVSLYFR